MKTAVCAHLALMLVRSLPTFTCKNDMAWFNRQSYQRQNCLELSLKFLKCTTCFCYVLLLENSFYLINIVCLECPKHFMLYHIVVFCFMFFVLFLFSFFSFCFVLLFVLLCFAFDFGKSFYWSHRVWNAPKHFLFCFVVLCCFVFCFVLLCFLFWKPVFLLVSVRARRYSQKNINDIMFHIARYQ